MKSGPARNCRTENLRAGRVCLEPQSKHLARVQPTTRRSRLSINFARNLGAILTRYWTISRASRQSPPRKGAAVIYVLGSELPTWRRNFSLQNVERFLLVFDVKMADLMP